MGEIVRLSEPEQARLEELEERIGRNLRSFVEVAQDLTEIRDRDLYRARYGTFEDYCRERWDFTRQRAYQLLGAAEVSTVVVTEGLPAPSSEGVARGLVPLRDEPERLRAVWERAIERGEGRPTAADVVAVRAELVEPEPELEPEPKFGKRKLNEQRQLVRGIVTYARRIETLDVSLDLAVVSALDDEERDEWEGQLYTARTILSRLIAAL